jgi:DNA-binding beta-propeller fold protein YncE
MNNHIRNLFALILVFISGCASTPPELKQEPVFYPGPPELPRIQYLTSFSSSLDIEPEKSSLDKFVIGGQQLITSLDKPYGVAIHDGKIYVCDTNATVVVIDLKKRTFGPLSGAQGRGKLIQPINISIDKNGNKYVADVMKKQVALFDKNDFYVKAYELNRDWKPVDAVAYGDKLYVADAKNKEVQVFSLATGEHMQSLGSQGEPKDKLVIPTNLAFDSEGYLYVTDTGKFQVVKLDRDGNVRSTIGQLGSQLGFFARPRGIALDRDNRLYAVDAAFDNVQIFTKEGQLLFFFGKAGQAPGDLYLPAKVSIDYENIEYFKRYADPSFEIEALILVTSQFGIKLVNIYGLGKEKGKKYPTEEELRKIAEDKLRKQEPGKPEKKDQGEVKK